MKKSFNFNNLFCLTVLLMLFSCQQDLEDPQITGKVEFTFNTSKSLEGKAAKNNIEDARYVLVKIAKDDGEVVYENEKLELYKFGDDFVSEPLALSIGNYQLLEFLILDENNQVIFATPLKGSELASLVTNPLPMDFEVAQDVTLKLVPEVVDVDGTTAEAFGYTTFSFDPILVWDFQLSVFAYDYNTENFELTEANLYVINGEDTAQTETLEAAINYIALQQESEHYTLVISKEGYQSYNKEFMAEDLRGYLNNPLVVVLEEGKKIMIKLGPDDGKDSNVSSHWEWVDKNFGLGSLNVIAWTHNQQINNTKAYIDFEINHKVANADDIEQVYLYLNFCYNCSALPTTGGGNSGDNAMYVRRVTSPWEELSITWNSQPTVSEENKVLVPAGTKTQDYKIDVTDLVKDMINDPDNSYGFNISLVNYAKYKGVFMASSENVDPAIRPKLEIIKK